MTSFCCVSYNVHMRFHCQLTFILPLFIEFNDFDHTLAGDPASGKGYRCPKIVEHLGFTDLCAGGLLEAETKSGSENWVGIYHMFSFCLSFLLWRSGCYFSLSPWSQCHYCFNYHSYDNYYFTGHNVFGCTFSKCELSLHHAVTIAFHSPHCRSRKMICNFKLEGNILPSEITVELLQRAMQKSESRKYIINGFHVMKKILLHLGTV